MKPDSGFVQEAASGGLMEVQLGQIAQQKAASSAVKQFASQTLPTLQEHLRLAKRVAGQVGADTTGAGGEPASSP